MIQSTIYTGKPPQKEIFQVFEETMKLLLNEDNKVIYLDADLMSSMKTGSLWEKNPKQVFNCGIQEANMVGVAAGMYLVGMKPYIHTFAPFATRRVFDQLYISVGYAGKSLRVIGSEPGICAADNGGTHMTFEDISLIRTIPNSCIIDVSDANMFCSFLRESKERLGVTYFRTPRRNLPDVYPKGTEFAFGKGKLLREGQDLTIIASGIMVSSALEAFEILKSEGISACIIDPITIKPLDKELIVKCAKATGAVVTAENHSIYGGLGGVIAEVLSENCPVPVIRTGIMDLYGEVGSMDYLREKFNLNPMGIVNGVKAALNLKGAIHE